MIVAGRDPDFVFSKVNITDEQRAKLLDTIHKKMASNPLKIRVDFMLTCTAFDGVDIIREALLTAKHAVNTDGWKLEFKMIAPPTYMCQVMTHRRAEGEEKLKQALEVIQRVMKEKGGRFQSKGEPVIIGANKDELDTADLLDNLKQRQVENGEGEAVESGEEDNDEGMGELDAEDPTAHDEESDEDDK